LEPSYKRSLHRNLQKPREILSSTPAAARLRNKTSEERFYKPPGSGEFSPLGSSRRPNLFNNSISARPSPSVGISLLDILDGSSLGVEPVQGVSCVPREAAPPQVALPGPQLDTSNTNSRIDDDDYAIFNSDDSDFGSAESESTEAEHLQKLDGYNCICLRARGLTYCKDCRNIVPGSRVKMTCQAHPKMFLTCDLLICPKCKSSAIIEVDANN